MLSAGELQKSESHYREHKNVNTVHSACPSQTWMLLVCLVMFNIKFEMDFLKNPFEIIKQENKIEKVCLKIITMYGKNHRNIVK